MCALFVESCTLDGEDRNLPRLQSCCLLQRPRLGLPNTKGVCIAGRLTGTVSDI